MSALGVGFRQLETFSRISRRGSISCVAVRTGREWPNLGALAARHTQRPPTYRDPFFSSPVPEGHLKPDTAFITPAAAEEKI